jgi:DNA-binding CsgD family transcriptional regulator
MNGFDGNALIHDLAAAKTPVERFDILTQGLAKLGLDTVNYGFFDTRAADMGETPIQFLTTMSEDWMRYYYERSLEDSDPHVTRVKASKITPYLWNESVIRGVASSAERHTAMEATEAGLRSALCVPLTSPLNPFAPVGGITLGSSLGEEAFKRVMQEHGATLASIAHVFHHASIRQLWHARDGNKLLTARERDCVRYLAEGKRQDGIAQALGLARVTVEMHLRAARQKLGAQTLNEAVAKALVLGEITID